MGRRMVVGFKAVGTKTEVVRVLVTVLTVLKERVSTLQDIILAVNNRLVRDMRG